MTPSINKGNYDSHLARGLICILFRVYSILSNCIQLMASTILLKISRHFTSISKFFITPLLYLYKERKVDYFKSIEFYQKISAFLCMAKQSLKYFSLDHTVGCQQNWKRKYQIGILLQELSRIGFVCQKDSKNTALECVYSIYFNTKT